MGYHNVYLVTDQPITALQQQFPCSPAHQVGSGNSTNNPSAKASAHLMRKKKRGSGKIYIYLKKKKKKSRQPSHQTLTKTLRPCLDLYFFITHHSISVTHHSLLITHHLKYPTRLVFVFTSHHSNISTICGTHCRSTLSVSIVSLPTSLNSFHFIFFSFSHHCPVTLPTQTQTQVR